MHFLDIDLYKLVNQYAIFVHYPQSVATWRLTNRSPEFVVTEDVFRYIESKVIALGDVVITKEELEFLRRECPYFSDNYLKYLAQFRYNINTLSIVFKLVVPTQTNTRGQALGSIAITATGNWCETTLFESPILQIMTESFHRFVLPYTGDYSDQEGLAYEKGTSYVQCGIPFADFGARRRRSLHGQQLVLQGIQQAQAEHKQANTMDHFLGSSNVHLCRQLGLKPVSTMSHEWFMGIGAITGDYDRITTEALSRWADLFGPWLRRGDIFGLALPDAFGSELFLRSFGDFYDGKKGDLSLVRQRFSDLYSGLRHDSGDALEFIAMAQSSYASGGTEYASGETPNDAANQPLLMFSNSLKLHNCRTLMAAARKAGFQACFALGSSLTNDFPDKHRSPNMVFKLSSVDGKMAVKISNVPGKELGDPSIIAKIRQIRS